jgi:hypothetical protein
MGIITKKTKLVRLLIEMLLGHVIGSGNSSDKENIVVHVGILENIY